VNKSELVDTIAESAELTKVSATKALEAVVASITSALKDGEQVVLVGFGTFGVKDRAARTGRNPKTGEPLQIPAARVPSFKAGKMLKEAVN